MARIAFLVEAEIDDKRLEELEIDMKDVWRTSTASSLGSQDICIGCDWDVFDNATLLDKKELEVWEDARMEIVSF